MPALIDRPAAIRLEGRCVVSGDDTPIVLLPPEEDVEGPYPGNPRIIIDMGQGYRLVFVNLGPNADCIERMRASGLGYDPATRDFYRMEGDPR